MRPACPTTSPGSSSVWRSSYVSTPRYGYRRIGDLLRREGFRANPKRIYRLWKREGYRVARQQHKRRRLGTSENAGEGLARELGTLDAPMFVKGSLGL
ncbi:MAG: IS3 family transposase [Thermoleophilia bacterium]